MIRRVVALALVAALGGAAIMDASEGPSCVDTHNNCLDWAWKGECEKNAKYMRSACRQACKVCSRNATVSVNADGTVEAHSWNELSHDGVFPDPTGTWAGGDVRNPFAAMTKGENGNGVLVTLIHAAAGAGPVDVLWESDGRTRDSDGGVAIVHGFAPGGRTELNTFENHVFRFTKAGDHSATLGSFKVMPHRPTFTLDDSAIEKYASGDWCADSDGSCEKRAARGECATAPGWMIMKCAKSCESCHLRDPDVRCRRDHLNVRQTPGLEPGGVHALFESLNERWPQFNVTIHSRPGGAREGEDPALDIADGPWVATFDNFLSEKEGSDIISTVNTQFSRSTDQGKVDKYGEQQKVVSTSRTSENAWCTGKCESHPATKAVMGRIRDVTGVPVENYESFQVLRYTKGQQYRAHHDMSRSDNKLACGPRIYTFFLYLSDVEEGGATEFPNIRRPSGEKVRVTPKRGSALLWPSVMNDDPSEQDPRTSHAALPVIKGTKFAANAWIHLFDYSEPNVWGCTGAFD